MGFQASVNAQQAPAVAGDFATSNPRSSFPTGEAGFVAGAAGVIVGLFAWVQSGGRKVLNTGTGVPQGFVHREQQGLVTTYLAESGNTIPVGKGVTLMSKGDFYVKATVGPAVMGMKAYAKLADGTIQFDDAGETISGFIETPFVCTVPCLVNELAVMSL